MYVTLQVTIYVYDQYFRNENRGQYFGYTLYTLLYVSNLQFDLFVPSDY